MATSGIGRLARLANLATVSTNQTSVEDDGCSITRAPVLHLAIGLDINKEMKEPPKPISAAKASNMPKLSPLAVR